MDTIPAPEPAHGESRNHHLETTCAPPAELQIAGGGTISVSLSSHTATVSERYCRRCKAWVRCSGIVAHLLCLECKTGWSDNPDALAS